MVLAQLIYIYSLPQNYQNTQLFHDIETGRAQMNRIRISYTEPKQGSANDYTTSLQHTVSRITQHPMTRYACPSSTACTQCIVLLMITLAAKQNTLLHRKIESGRAQVNRIRISYAEPKQSTSTSTHPFRAKTEHPAFPRNPIRAGSFEKL